MEDTVVFGRVRVLVARRELWVDGRLAPIGARALDVLIALLNRPGELVTEGELRTAAWGDAAVEDGAIAAEIAAVRRALGDRANGGRHVRTAPGQGYRFVARIEAPDSPRTTLGPTPRPTSPPRRAHPPPWMIAAAVGIVALGIAFAAWRLGGPRWRIERSENLIDAKEVQTDAVGSPDGSMIAYAAGEDREHRRIYVRRLSGGEPSALTGGDNDESSPAWSPAGDALAYVSSREGRPCVILIRPFPAGSDRVAGHCIAGWTTTLAWAKDGRSLYFSDRVRPDAQRTIRRLNLATGASAAVTNPPGTSNGDTDPALSPDGGRLAFQRSTPRQSVEIVRDLASGTEHEVTPDGLNITSAAWVDDHALLVATLPPDPSALWVYPVDGGLPRRLTETPVEIRRVTANGAGLVGFESQSLRHDLAYASAAATDEPELIDSGPGAVNGLDYSADGALVFAQSSGGLGGWDVWVRRPGGPSERITTLSADYIESPTWSPDGGRIAFQANVGDESGIFVMRSDGSGLHRLTRRLADYGGPAWMSGGAQVVYLTLVGGVWQIWRADADGSPNERPLDTRGWAGVRSAGGGILALHDGDGGVWRLGSAPALVAPGVSVRHSLDWCVGGGGVVYIDRAQAGPPRVVIHPLAGEPDRVLFAPRAMAIDWVGIEGVFGGLALDPRSGRPVYVRSAAGAAHIGALRLTRN